MLRHLIVALLVLLGSVGMASAQNCASNYQIGDAVGIPWLGDIRPAAVLTGPEGESCVYTVRFTPRPGDAFDLYPRTYGEVDIVDLPFAPPYRKPYGCPYESGDAVDFQDYYKSTPWYPATVETVDADCVTRVTYQATDGAELGASVSQSMVELNLRPAQLQRQDAGQLRRDADDKAAALLCQNEEYMTVESDAFVPPATQALTEFDAGLTYTPSRTVVTFEGVVAGRSFRVDDGSTFQRNHTRALPGGTAIAYRVKATVCHERDGKTSETKKMTVDLFCFSDYFDETICER